MPPTQPLLFDVYGSFFHLPIFRTPPEREHKFRRDHFGKITGTAGDPRDIQLAAKFYF